MTARNDLRHTRAAHDLADAHGRHVAGDVGDPSTHRGVEREVEVAHKQLTLARLADRPLAALEVRRLDHPHRTARQHPLPVALLVHLPSLLDRTGAAYGNTMLAGMVSLHRAAAFALALL